MALRQVSLELQNMDTGWFRLSLDFRVMIAPVSESAALLSCPQGTIAAAVERITLFAVIVEGIVLLAATICFYNWRS